MRGDVVPPRSYPPVLHYYGDYTRRALVAAALVVLVTTPFIPGLSPYDTIASVVIVAVLAVSAGLTNPHSRGALIFDALLAAVCIMLFVAEAVREYESGHPVLAEAHGLVAALTLFALYFSVKSVRTMTMHLVGKNARTGEFGGNAEHGV